jgi:hypothetical protein
MMAVKGILAGPNRCRQYLSAAVTKTSLPPVMNRKVCLCLQIVSISARDFYVV